MIERAAAAHNAGLDSRIFAVGRLSKLEPFRTRSPGNQICRLADQIGHHERLFNRACRQQHIHCRIRAFLRTGLGILLLNRQRVAGWRSRNRGISQSKVPLPQR